MFISIEGLDGVGKSTIAKGLSVALNLPFTSNRPPIGVLKELTDRSLEAHFLYYLMSIYRLGENIKLDGHQAVFDSYLLRPISAHEAMGVNPAVIVASLPLIKRVHKPDKNFLLTCQHDERIRRLTIRNKNFDPFDIVDSAAEKKALDSYKKWGRLLQWSISYIDTTFIDANTVITTIVELMK